MMTVRAALPVRPGGVRDGVKDCVLVGRAGVDRDGGRGRAMEHDDDTEIDVTLVRNNARTEVTVRVADFDRA